MEDSRISRDGTSLVWGIRAGGLELPECMYEGWVWSDQIDQPSWRAADTRDTLKWQSATVVQRS